MPPLPDTLQVEITSACNLACTMCPLTLGATLSSASCTDAKSPPPALKTRSAVSALASVAAAPDARWVERNGGGQAYR